MATGATANARSYMFDDRNIRWNKLGDLEHFVFAVLDVDAPRKVVDFIIKFAPNQRIILHRHLALTNTLVIQGEHRLYEPNGALKEVRAVGSYTSSQPGEPHQEGGGDQHAVVVYSVRGKDGVLFELLNDDLNVVGTLSMEDFIQAFEEQKRAGG
jgi:quercetin dioxygenase-like cupin family protein